MSLQDLSIKNGINHIFIWLTTGNEFDLKMTHWPNLTWDKMIIFSKSESWHIKKNDTLGKASALAVMRRTDEYSNYCWTPLDYLGDDGESGQDRIQNVFYSKYCLPQLTKVLFCFLVLWMEANFVFERF